MIIRFYDVLESTNVTAKEEAAKGAEDGTVFVADRQTAGRGRRGREWSSPAGGNLYFSLLLRPEFRPELASMLTLVMALAVAKGMDMILQGEGDRTVADLVYPMIKWPNDIVMDGKKVCGILTEMGMKQKDIDYVIIGVGVNVCKQQFAPELVEKATDLETACGQKVNREDLLHRILECFEAYYAAFLEQGNLCSMREEYNGRLVNLGREVCVLDPKGEFTGVATGITETGELSVRLPDDSVTEVYAGEVSVRGIYGYV